jgi:hypothetical protein
MNNLFSNTGTVSFILYGVFIAITIIALFVAIRQIVKGVIPADKLDKMIDLFKYAIVTTAIATTTLIITDLFKEREQDINELEYFDKYVQDVKKVDNIQERLQLCKYLSIVAPSGEMKKSWQAYYTEVQKEYEQYLSLKAADQASHDSVAAPASPNELRNELLINAAEKPLVTEAATSIVPAERFVVNANADGTKAAQYEQRGFELLMNGNYSEAATAFTQSENAKNGFHASYELANLLRRKAPAMSTSESERREVLREVATRFGAYAPAEAKQWLDQQVKR